MDDEPFDHGVRGCRLRWLEGLRAVESTHGTALAALAGRTLTHVWLVWDLDDDSWFADAPVLLDLDGEHVLVSHRKFADLAIEWHAVDVAAPVRWGGSDFRLAWRADPLPGLADVAGRTVRGVELLVCRSGDLADGMVAVGLDLGGPFLMISNGLDENRVDVGAPGNGWERHPVAARP